MHPDVWRELFSGYLKINRIGVWIVMKKIVFKGLAVVLCVLVFAGAFYGCSAKSVKVVINDMQTETKVSVLSGKTVSDALSEAEIKLNKKDTVEPDEDTKIEKDTKIVIKRYADAVVECDGKIKNVALTGATVEDAVKKAGVKVFENDEINYKKTAFVTNGMKIKVTRRLNVNLFVDGKKKTFLTKAKTVKGVLEEQKIKLNKNDIVKPASSKKVKADMKITVKRVSEKTITKTETINYTTKYVTSSSLKAGATRITTQGVNGEKKVTYKVTYVNGKESEKKKVSEKIIKAPVAKVIQRGTMQATQAPTTKKSGKTEVSRQRVADCNGSGHGYYIIKYSDGTTKYEDY